MAYDARESAVGLSAGVYASVAATMALWLVADGLWWPALHLGAVIAAWLFAWHVARRAGALSASRAVLYGGVPVVIVGIFGVLAVFVRVYN